MRTGCSRRAKNFLACTCHKKDCEDPCPRAGICCECVAHHREKGDVPECLQHNFIKILDQSFAGNPPDWLKDYGRESELPSGTKGRVLKYKVRIRVEVMGDLLCSNGEYCGHTNGEILDYPDGMGRVCRHMIGKVNEAAKSLVEGGTIPVTTQGWSLWEKSSKNLTVRIPCIDKEQCIYYLDRISKKDFSKWD